ncbi:hypothetical protein PWT90_09713 [Aphanocladium album]|nr:hypothetical protein PWT90_09713 [Aphanocladium album]
MPKSAFTDSVESSEEVCVEWLRREDQGLANSSTLASDAEPASYSTAVAEESKLDPLIRNTRSNGLYSPLLRLPEPILSSLLETFDMDTVLRLRHVSRVFMRLFHHTDHFKEYHRQRKLDHVKVTSHEPVWARPTITIQGQSTSWIGSSCDNCPEVREEEILRPKQLLQPPSIYCSGCHISHRPMHFSKEQAASKHDHTRLCRAHESKASVCAHLSLSLGTIKQLASLNDRVFLACNGVHDQGLARDFPECSQDSTTQVSARRRTNGCKIILELSFCSHIRLKRLPSGKLCPDSLRTEFFRLERMNADRVWQPEFGAAFGNPLRAFDPNFCDCVDWSGGSSVFAADKARFVQSLNLRTAKLPAWKSPFPWFKKQAKCAAKFHEWDCITARGIGRLSIRPCESSLKWAHVFQALDVEIDPIAPSGPGWGHLLDYRAAQRSCIHTALIP